MDNGIDSIIEKLREILINDIGLSLQPSDIDPEAGLASVLGVDSIGFIELRYQCEEKFGIRIADSDFTPANFSTCSALAAFVAGKAPVH
ncbi:MAG: acyl carrier protein [Methanobacterium sp.]|nr:acyl carrier protein [Methanobacterium sp.]